MITGFNEKTGKAANRYPLIFIVFVLSSILTVLIDRLFFKEDSRNGDCQEQIAYLRERVEKLEKQVDDYTISVMFQEAQVKNRDLIIDSLRKEVIR